MTEFIVRGKGEASVRDMKVLQDGPPPGGFPSVRFGRRIPSSGPAGSAIFGVSALVIAYGFYKVRARPPRRERASSAPRQRAGHAAHTCFTHGCTHTAAHTLLHTHAVHAVRCRVSFSCGC
jgi:hypothetical protein